MAARALMAAGTSSHSGKSWMATALCRHLRRRGLRVAPFKAQNMSLNSYPCADGGEIGRSQVAQAEACTLEPHSDMNPILLKPTSPSGSQVIVNGKVWKQLSARDYYRQFDFLLEQALAAYQRLASRFDFVVLEGAGSASEINLRERDLVNLPLAARLGVPALLVADIERGGVFGSVVGTVQLLEPEERRLLRSVAVNRFRGDLSLFGSGRRMLEERSGLPCLGVFPFLEDAYLDPEDVLSLADGPARAANQSLDIAIVRLPHISNFTDFRLLDARYVTAPSAEPPDVIILPGSKATIADLHWLRERGLDRWLLSCHRQGTAIWGVCGGYQMLGHSIADPQGVESAGEEVPGLGLLPVETRMLAEKRTEAVRARTPGGVEFAAYEIHMGETVPACGDRPFAWIGGRGEGHRADGVLGTYLHGALEHPELLDALLVETAERRGKSVPGPKSAGSKEANYDRLADWFEQNADLDLFERLYLR